jgi:hypothetical protein
MNLDRRPRDGILVLPAHGAPSGIAVRLLGLLILAGGSYAVQRIVTTRGWTADCCWLGLVGLLALTGLVMLAGVDDLVVDLAGRTYVRRSGLWPLLRRRPGKLNEMAAIRVCSEMRPLRPREGVSDLTAPVLVVTLHWKNPSVRPFRLAETRPFAEEQILGNLRAQAKRLGLMLGVPVLEPSGGIDHGCETQ